MSDLAAFLRERLDEDEAVARTADERVSYWYQPGEDPEHLEWEHIARHGPARVLAEVAAKRAIVDLHWQWQDEEGPVDICDACDGMRYPCLTMLHLAVVYADHPDYDEAWKP